MYDMLRSNRRLPRRGQLLITHTAAREYDDSHWSCSGGADIETAIAHQVFTRVHFVDVSMLEDGPQQAAVGYTCGYNRDGDER